ncbi:hypothetical protein BDZ85DRAFT_247229 [Elsinoe ampelina]|uniref:Uncharacterized protein n=1 Tax=Elsinoe ampelina TaxID=302913 RepID=A0A6A6GMY2_9PEZI|nr:hypothetical protein BDZ85DRAFT_247229 [Elsinoe ampelina]
MPSHPFTSPWRTTMMLTNLVYCFGAFIMDYGETHVLNPRWPPHARFHNGQTMSLGVLLCSMVGFVLTRPSESKKEAKNNVTTAGLIGSMYCTAGMTAILYPGTNWSDPEFEDPGQKWLFSGLVVINLAAMVMEWVHIDRTWDKKRR